MKLLKLTVNCTAVYNSGIWCPDDMTFEEAIQYAKDHPDKFPLGELNCIKGPYILDVDNCNFDE